MFKSKMKHKLMTVSPELARLNDFFAYPYHVCDANFHTVALRKPLKIV
jgi:hypothetical protein